MPETDEPDDDIALSGEYALGLLDAQERSAFETRLGGDPRLRQLVADWQESLVTLTGPVQPVQPPQAVYASVERRLFGRPAGRAAARNARRMSWPFALAGGMVGALAVLAIVVVLPFLAAPPPSSPGPTYAATIQNKATGLAIQARYDPSTERLIVDRKAGKVPAGHSLQLWVIPNGQTRPLSLGVIDQPSIQIALPADMAANIQTGTLAVSEEPPGGAPGDTPTTVLGSGPVQLQ